MSFARALFVTLLFAAGAEAQTVSLQTKFCSATAPAIAFYISAPAPFGIPIPVCVTLGPTLKLSQVNGTFQLDAIAPAAPPAQVPSMFVETVALSTAGPTDAILQYNLKHTPAPNTAALMFFASSQVGASVVSAVPSPTTQVQFTLPAYRPFTADDVVTIVYWSLN